MTKNLNLAGFLGLPPQVPLFYSKPWGQEQLANTYLLPLPIVLAIIFLACNIALILFLVKQDKFVQKILLIGATCTLILSAITVIRIVFLVF